MQSINSVTLKRLCDLSKPRVFYWKSVVCNFNSCRRLGRLSTAACVSAASLCRTHGKLSVTSLAFSFTVDGALLGDVDTQLNVFQFVPQGGESPMGKGGK